VNYCYLIQRERAGLLLAGLLSAGFQQRFGLFIKAFLIIYICALELINGGEQGISFAFYSAFIQTKTNAYIVLTVILLGRNRSFLVVLIEIN
jgi:hypothetical protein